MSEDITKVKEKTVACDGENYKSAGDTADSGHPKVYLTIKDGEGKDGSVTCPYCGRKFIYER